MERELLELFEAAKKAADAAASDGVSSGGSHVDRCLDALKQLRDFPVTYDVLVATQVAKRLRHLTKHPIEEIQTSVSYVIDIWKKIIIDETVRKKNGTTVNMQSKKTVVKGEVTVKAEDAGNSGSGNAVSVSKMAATKIEKLEGCLSRAESFKIEKKVKLESTVKAEKVDRSQTVKVEKAMKVENKVGPADNIKAEKGDTAKVEKISKDEKQAYGMKKPSQASNAPPKLTSLIKCNDPLRDKMRELLLEALSKVPSEADGDIKDQVDECDPIRVAVAVESVMFDKMGKSNGSQKVKYRSMMFNLKDPKNPDLRRKVLLGEVKPERLINMTPEEMASDQRRRENKQIKDKALFECERGVQQSASTDQFKCGRCGQRKTTYYQMQTRSADEPMTTYVTCVNCNNRWKFC